MAEVIVWLSGASLLVGLITMTIAVAGMVRLRDPYLRVHAASAALFGGVFAIALASIGTLEGRIVVRALVVGIFVLLTNPVSSHAIARAAFLTREPMIGEDAVDESGRLPSADESPTPADTTDAAED